MESDPNDQYANGRIMNTFTFAVQEIKNKSERAGNPVTDDEIARKLLITTDEYSMYLRMDSVPMEILQTLHLSFAAFSTFKFVDVELDEREIDPPPPPDPDELDVTP